MSGLEKSLTSKTTKNAVKYFQKNAGKAINGIVDGVADSVVLTTTQNALTQMAGDISKKEE